MVSPCSIILSKYSVAVSELNVRSVLFSIDLNISYNNTVKYMSAQFIHDN